MLVVDIGIVGGADTDEARNICSGVFARMEHLFTFELNFPLRIVTWDYRIDTPRIVRAGDLSARSLAMVDQAEALLAIFAESVPDITRQEIQRAFERRQSGHNIEVWVFMNPETRTDQHDDFIAEIADAFGEQIIWTPYSNLLEIQANAFMTLLPFLMRRSGFTESPARETP